MRCQESEPALISVIFSLLLCLNEVKYHWSVNRKRQENCQSILLHEEWLDSHGIGNEPLILTTKNNLSTFGVRGRVDCACYWCFNKISACISLNFKLAKEGAGNSSWKYVNELGHTCVANCTYKNDKCTWLQTGNEKTHEHEAVFLPAKTRLPKHKTTWNRVCVLC